MRLIRNPADRALAELVRASRFIASSDLYSLSDRTVQKTSVALKELARSGHVRRVCSAQRIPKLQGYAKKTYIYTVGDSPQGHIVHWVYLAHIRAAFTRASRALGLEISWEQSRKHKQTIPDAIMTVNNTTYLIELDNSTEGMSVNGIAGKPLSSNTLIVCMKSLERLYTLSESDEINGFLTFHGLFHGSENTGRLLKDRVWWNGSEWVAIL